jgi:hypothetical protein
MEFTVPPQLLLVIASAIILLTALGARVVRDASAISQAHRLNRQLIKVGRSRLKTGVSVVIELHKKADTIIPLLNHLHDQSYAKLEVIIILKHTAGKNARPVLTRYKQTHSGIRLRLVSHRVGMTQFEVIRRFATNPLVMTLFADQKLSPHFFSHISIDYALERPDYIIPKQYAALDNTIRSALVSHAVFLNSKSAAASTSTLVSGIVYKRASLLRRPKTEHTRLSHSSYTVTSAKPYAARGLSTPRITVSKLMLIIAAILGLLYVALSLKLPDTLFLLGLIVAAYVFIYATSLIGLKAYSLIEKISLVLLSPLFMTYRIISYIREIVLIFGRTSKRLFTLVRRRFVTA